MTTQRVFKAAMIALILPSLTACGQNARQRSRVISDEALGTGVNGMSLSSLDANATCSDNDPNVLPTSQGLNSTPPMTVCPLDADAYTIDLNARFTITPEMLYTGAPRPERVCVFPAEYVPATATSGARVVWKIDTTGLPMVTCKNIPANGVIEGLKFTFTSTRFDTIFAVEESNRDQMMSCLINNNANLCPNYSRGRFR